MTHEELQSNLPALAAGRLRESESLRLESHVRGCPECTVILADLRRVADSIARQGEALFDEHPDPGVLERLARGEPVSGREAIERHLHVCSACSREAASPEEIRPHPERPRRRLLPWILAASSLVAAGMILGAILGPLPGRPGATWDGPIDLPVLQRTTRGGTPVTRIAVREGQPVVVLAIPLDLSGDLPGSGTMRLEVLRPGGDPVYLLSRPARWFRRAASGSGIVPLSIRSDRLPPGTYQVTVSGGPGPGDLKEILWFEIVRGEDPDPGSGAGR